MSSKLMDKPSGARSHKVWDAGKHDGMRTMVSSHMCQSIAEFMSLVDWTSDANGKDPSPWTEHAGRTIWTNVIDKEPKGYAESVGWYGVPGNQDGFYAECARGWPDGCEEMRKVEQEVESGLGRIRNAKRKAAKRASGDELDIHAVRAGSLDRAWRRMELTECNRRKRGKHVRIMVDYGVNCATPAARIMETWTAAWVVAKRLSEAGASVEVWAVQASKNSWHPDGISSKTWTGYDESSVCIKQRSMPLAMSSFAMFALGGMFRIYGFAANMTAPGPCHFGLGQSGDWMRHRDRYGSQLKRSSAKDVFIRTCKSKDDAVRVAKDAIAEALA